MEDPVPDWLTAEFLTQCLQPEPGYKDIVITGFSASRAVPLGEQYISCPIRVKVEYKKDLEIDELHNKSLILKSELTAGVMKEVTESFESSESIFYQRFLPKAMLFSNVSFAPKCFFSPEISVIVLEDLKEKGFMLGNKTKGLDFQHCRLYVTAVAALHAASATLLAEDPGLKNSIIGKEKIFSRGQRVSDGLKKCGFSGMKCLAEYTETSDRFNKYTDLIKDFSMSIFDIVVEAVKPREDEFNVICHGDAWVNNLMFRYNDEGAVCEVKLLDFQMTRYSSPLVDLVYFFWSSASDDVRATRLQELFMIYMEELNKNLKYNNCSQSMSWKSLKVTVDRLLPLGIYMALFLQPIIAEKPIQTIEPFFAYGREEECYTIFKSYFSDKEFLQNRLPKLVEQLETAGVFDYLKNYKVQHKHVHIGNGYELL